ncbi:MAG: hypothetical protein U0694_05950 [Anaerolineae bacterium]
MGTTAVCRRIRQWHRADAYLTNVEAAHALALEYGFQFYAFVQPVPMVEQDYTEEEQRFIWDTPGGLVDLFVQYIRVSATLRRIMCITSPMCWMNSRMSSGLTSII